MKIKLLKLEGCETSKQLLVYLTPDGDGDYLANIVAWHTTPAGDEYIQESSVVFDFKLQAERYIADFSELTACEIANDFAENNILTEGRVKWLENAN